MSKAGELNDFGAAGVHRGSPPPQGPPGSPGSSGQPGGSVYVVHSDNGGAPVTINLPNRDTQGELLEV
jgi:hypothetical protein